MWPGVERLDSYREARLALDIKRHVKERLKSKISSHSAIDLIDKLLVLDPSKRLTADDALSHDYFYEDPPPGDLRSFSRSGSSYLEFLSANSRPRQAAAAQQAAAARNQPHAVSHQSAAGHHVTNAGHGHNPNPGIPNHPPGHHPGQRQQGPRRGPAMPEDNIHFDRVY